MAGLGPPCCADFALVAESRAYSGCREQGLLWLQGAGPTLVVVRGLLVVVASLVAEHVGSVVAAPDSRAHAQ